MVVNMGTVDRWFPNLGPVFVLQDSWRPSRATGLGFEAEHGLLEEAWLAEPYGKRKHLGFT